MANKGYNYIWYPLTNFIEIPSDEFKFKLSEILSPYIELNLTAITQIKKGIETEENKILEVNPFIRFADIFYILLNPDEYKYNKKLRDSFFNILIHFLGELDLYLGQNKKDIIIKEMVKNIEKGAFGEEVKENFKVFKEYEKVIIADGLYCIKFIQELFLPLGLDIDLFWEKHFGVIGVDITMRIGEIAIF